MKFIVWILVFLSVFLSFWNVYSATNSIFKNSTNEIPYCNDWDKGCWLEEWIKAVKKIGFIENERKASVYIQDVVVNLLRFLALIATLIIIYAWFNLLTAVWDEEKAGKSKKIILYAVLWLFIIFIAWPLIEFVLNIIN